VPRLSWLPTRESSAKHMKARLEYLTPSPLADWAQLPIAVLRDVAEVRVHRPVINPRLQILDRGNDCAYSLGIRVAR
jgi:hypothetical protein